MEETNTVGITADKTNIDRGQESSESMMMLSLTLWPWNWIFK